MRSLRGKRGRIVTVSVVLMAGLLILALQDKYAPTLLSPGPLTLNHGEVGGCGNCHDAFGGGPIGWIHAAFASAGPLADSKKCLACHELGGDAFRPHGLASGALAALTREIAPQKPAVATPVGLTASRALFGTPVPAASAIGCANCHEEHRGQGFDQTEMTNGRCQSCHSLQFASLSRGHPEFEAYPFTRRTRINFDHASHFQRHFEKAGRDQAPATCADCHTPAPDGRFMLVGGFAETCAACHLEQIEGVDRVDAKGIPFLTAPGLDLAELRQRGATIGEWPEWSEATLTPFMKILLAEDAAFAADLGRLETLDLLDLSGSSDEQIAAVERLVWRVKSLIYRLIASGATDMAGPLSEALGQRLDRIALGRLFGVVPSDVVRAAQVAWFPNLAEEIERTRRGERVAIPGDPEAEATPAETADTDAATEPVAGDGDDILSGDEDDILSEEQGDILSGDEGDILSGDEGDILSEEQGDILSGDESDLLSGDESDLLSEEQGDILSGDEGDILSGDEGDILSESEVPSDEDTADATATAVEGEETAATMPEPDAEKWALLGGWYRRDFALYYKPLDHADRFVRTWLDVSGRTFGTPRQPVGAALFTVLADKRSPGSCTKCHSVDREADGAMNVKWKSRRPNRGVKSATVFAHATHFSMLREEGCLTCHALAQAAGYADGYQDNDPFTFSSNFSPIGRETCAACHVEDNAGESCVLCHRYHVGAFSTRPVLTRMQ